MAAACLPPLLLARLLPLASLGPWAPTATAACRWASTSAACQGSGEGGDGDGGGASAAAADDGLAPGATFSLSKRFGAGEVAAWAALTGDSNAIHVDARAAAAAGLAAPILPGLLLAALFPAIIGSHFPGALYLSQTLRFRHAATVRCWCSGGWVWRHSCRLCRALLPALQSAAAPRLLPPAPPPPPQVGDAVTATLTVEKRSGGRVSFRTLCCDAGSGRVLVEGAALALIRRQQGAAGSGGSGGDEALR